MASITILIIFVTPTAPFVLRSVVIPTFVAFQNALACRIFRETFLSGTRGASQSFSLGHQTTTLQFQRDAERCPESADGALDVVSKGAEVAGISSFPGSVAS